MKREKRDKLTSKKSFAAFFAIGPFLKEKGKVNFDRFRTKHTSLRGS